MTDTVNVPREPTDAEVDAVIEAMQKPAPPIGAQPTNTLDRMRYLARVIASSVIAASPKAEPVSDLPPISLDGPHLPNDHRVWLARQLLDSKSDDATAYNIVAFHPAISDLWKKSKTFKTIKPEAPKVEQEPVAWVRAVGLLREAESRARPDTSARIKEFLYDLETGDLEVFSAPHPAPASDELLEAARFAAQAIEVEIEELQNSDNPSWTGLHNALVTLEDAIAKHNGPQS